MKKLIPLVLLFATTLLVSSINAQVLGSTIFNDTVGDTFPDIGILDISSVEVSHTASDLIFKISLTGDPVATDWGKYMIGIDSAAGGDTAGNAWGRPIEMTSGMNYWVGAWADSGNGGEVHAYNGASWDRQSATWDVNPDGVGLTKDTSSVTIQFAFAGLGLSLDDSFSFDIYTSGGGGGDSAIDSAANLSQTVSDWGATYSGSASQSYTLIPEPGTYAAIFGVLALAGAFVIRRRAKTGK